MSDSHHWSELDWANSAPSLVIHNIDMPYETQRITFPQGGINGGIGQIARDHFLLYQTIHDPGPTEVASLDIHAFNLFLPMGQQHLHPRSPTDGELRDVAISLDGNYIAWLVIRQPSSSFPNWIKRLLHVNQNSQRMIQSLWVSNLDGTHVHELGYLNLVSETASQIGIIKWLPDANHLSFEYQGWIYVIPVA